ncbi:MAG: dihydropteroate synthase [Sulfuriflexus sp.]|nr:dihydropteroate synthase [Sulfuriflexus sp.]
MGILNVTPDSFSDGGQFNLDKPSISQVEKMLQQGATLIDVGGESTRPGAADVSLNEELDRVISVIEKIASEFDTIISIDTSKPEVMTAAVKAGAGFINDVNALQADGALDVAVKANVPICLMHMQGEPRTMQTAPSYDDVTKDIIIFLSERMQACVDAGIDSKKLLIDPGFGFGKTLEQNCQLMRELNAFKELDCPVLVGVSRKSMIGQILDAEVDERVFGSVALETLAVWQGANIIRAHDVAAAMDAVKIATAVKMAGL